MWVFARETALVPRPPMHKARDACKEAVRGMFTVLPYPEGLSWQSAVQLNKPQLITSVKAAKDLSVFPFL